MKEQRKQIILFSNKIFHYRIQIYNYFVGYFEKNGYDFKVIAPLIDRNLKHLIKFDLIETNYSLINAKKIFTMIYNEDPHTVIFFFHLKDLIYWPIVLLCKAFSISIIYWNHGVNMQDPNNKIKHIFHNFMHSISDKLILYSKNELKYISNKNRNKVVIAPNTINFNEIPNIQTTKKQIRNKFGISKNKIALFVGRISPEKRVNYLIDIFKDSRLSDYLLVIVGNNLSQSLIKHVKQSNNIVYYDQIIDTIIINEIFKMSDIFVHPGAIGLSLNQAFYWGLPVITENVLHHPEIIYLKNNKNGFIVQCNEKNDFIEKIQLLFTNTELLKQFSKSAQDTILKEANIDLMANGFVTGFNTLK